MKKKSRIIVTALLVLLAVWGYAQGPNSGKAGPYDYPVKPGTPEWISFKTHDEMQRATMIPLSVLKIQSTRDLIVTCLTYPLFSDIYAFNDLQLGFESVKNGFNGIQELMVRKDAAQELLEKYKGTDPTAIPDQWSLEQKGNYSLNISNLEMLVLQDNILAGLSQKDRLQLLNETIRKYETKKSRPDVYGFYSQLPTVDIMAKLMRLEGYQPFIAMAEKDKELQYFIAGLNYLPNEKIDGIYQTAKQFITNK